jgi:hypothetical protein
MTDGQPKHTEPGNAVDGPASPFGDATNEFAAYLEYNKIVRSWFVAFGVGGPALFLVNEQLGKRLAESGQLAFVSSMFLLGAGCQVAGAVVNKISNWYVYRGSFDTAYRKTRRYGFFKWWVLQYWIDVVLDVTTIACFGVAAWYLLTLFGSG